MYAIGPTIVGSTSLEVTLEKDGNSLNDGGILLLSTANDPTPSDQGMYWTFKKTKRNRDSRLGEYKLYSIYLELASLPNPVAFVQRASSKFRFFAEPRYVVYEIKNPLTGDNMEKDEVRLTETNHFFLISDVLFLG